MQWLAQKGLVVMIVILAMMVIMMMMMMIRNIEGLIWHIWDVEE